MLVLFALIRGEISHRGLKHDLEVAMIGIESRDIRIAEMERLLRAVKGFEAKR